MAISRDTVQAAVERYLPRTVNYAQSEDLGEVDREATFRRIVQVVFTSLLLDKEAVFYIVYLSVQRLLASVDNVIDILESLESTDLLRGVSDVEPVRVQDLTKLVEAQEDLLSLSGSLSQGLFGTTHFADYSNSINAFLSSEIVPNVKGGNKVAFSRDVRSAMENLASAWSTVLSRRETVFSIIEQFQEQDFRIQVSSDIISAIRTTLLTIQDELPSLSTSEQAARAEEILVELAASKAALSVVANAENPFGTVISGIATDGYTQADYLLVEGNAKVEPILPLLRGSDGRIHIDADLFSSTGQTVDQGGDTTTELGDPSVVDFTAVVDAGQYLTFVETGARHTVSLVSISSLTLDPETPHLAATPQKYVLTDEIPGRLFKSLATDFWDEFSGGETGSTEILNGSAGAWIRDDKASGTDGTNLKGASLTGETWVLKDSGTLGTGGVNLFQDAGAAFISNGVLPGDEIEILTGFGAGVYIVDYLVSETSLYITTVFSAPVVGDSWEVRSPNYDEVFTDASATFLSSGIVAGDELEVLTSSQTANSPYTIASVDSQTTLTVSPPIFTAAASGISWQVRHAADVFVSASATFLSDGVEAGDILDLGVNGTYVIDSVDSQTKLTLTTNISPALSGETYAVYTSASSTSRFYQGDAVDFEAASGSNPSYPGSYLVGRTVSVTEYVNGNPYTSRREAILKVDGTDYAIDRLDPDQQYDLGDPAVDSLYVTTAATVDAGPLSWSIRVTDETYEFFDTLNTPFLAYAVGDILVYKPGTVDERRVAISEIVSSSHVRLSGTLPSGESGVAYAILSDVQPGLQLVAAGQRYDIEDVVSKHILKLKQTMPLSIGKNIEFYIVKRGNTLNSYRLSDEVSALTFGPTGFPSSLAGADLDIMAGRPLPAKVTRVADADGDTVFESFDINSRLRVGERRVAYRLRQLTDLTTKELLTTEVTAGDLLSGDVITVWGIEGVFACQAVPTGSPFSIPVEPSLPARLTSQTFIGVRGGAESHGRYLLMDSLNSTVVLEADTADFRLKVAQVLIDFGADLTNVDIGLTGDLSNDSDADGSTSIFDDLSADFVTAGVAYGDRISIVNGSQTYVSYVDAVVSPTRLSLNPEVPSGATALPWSIDRNSVSNSLVEAKSLREQQQALREVLAGYSIPRNATIAAVLEVLRQQGMDRAVNLLYDGQFSEFASMTLESSSYAGNARASIQAVGGSTTSSAATQSAVNGGLSENAYATTSSAYTQEDSVETVVALAKGVTSLIADERIRSSLRFNIEEARNRGIYELTGEIESGVISDEDPTLPWIAKTGSVKTKLESNTQETLDALQYMLDNPEEFDSVE